MNDSLTPAVPSHTPTRQRDAARPALLLALVAIALAGTAGWHAYSTRAELATRLTERLVEQEKTNREALDLAKRSEASTREMLSRLAVLESKVAESQGREVALEERYRELTKAGDDFALTEIEQALEIASQQLQLAGNVKTALVALTNVEERVNRLNRPQWVALRRAVAGDLERLRSLPSTDLTGLAVRLENLISSVDTLPLVAPDPAQETPAAQPAAPAGRGDSAFVVFLREVWREIRDLVRIREITQPEAALLAPSQSYFLRENLKLRLTAARIALLARDEQNFRSDLRAARDWLTRYFDAKQKPVASALTTLKQVLESPVAIASPDINGSLNAVRSLRATRERPPR